MIVGIDAANLRGGGAITHLMEMLKAFDPDVFGVKRVVVWGGMAVLNALEDYPWIDKRNPEALNGNLFQRMFWQRYRLSKVAHESGCNILFVPGGSYAGKFFPVVTMSQNLLPFELVELKRYSWSLQILRLFLLRVTQSWSFRRVDGLIFLTKYAKDTILKVTGSIAGQSRIIPHGLGPNFRIAPKFQKPISKYSDRDPYKVLYVSIIDQYKHQWHVVEAISILRKEGMPIVLDLIGPAYNPALVKLNNSVLKAGLGKKYVMYHGEIQFNELHNYYAAADLGLFASSCENMPNILLENMASGLPIACSSRGPMPEILGDAGIYFDPEDPHEIAAALRKLIKSPELRADLANASYEKSKQFSWQKCADETFAFLVYLAAENEKKLCAE